MRQHSDGRTKIICAKNTSWTELEIKAAVNGYFSLLDAQESNEFVLKAAVYRRLASECPTRSAKAFERKFQNISAILYEEKLHYVDGLLPYGNYQRLLKLIVLDHIGRIKRPEYSPRDILIQKLKNLYRRGLLPVKGKGSGRFGLTIEHNLGIPPNSDKKADFMGIEIKTKTDKSLQTLFSRVPSRYICCADKKELVEQYGYYDEKRGRQALYTSFSSKPDSLGFSLSVRKDEILISKNGTDLLAYNSEVLEAALLSKHSETAYVTLSLDRSKLKGERCRIEHLLYCRMPSIIRFMRLVEDGEIYLDFTMSINLGKLRDHGFLWRVAPEAIKDLYLETDVIDLSA